MMYVDDEPSGVVYTARCEWDHSRWWFAGTRTRPRERFHEALGQGAAPAPAAAVTGMPPRGSPSPTGVFPIRPSLSSASLPRAGGRSLSRAADAVSHTGSSEDPYFDMYPALMSAEEEQAAVAKQRAEQSLRMAFQGLRRLALASGLEDREIAAAACDECGVAGPGAERGRGAAEAAAAALSHGVAPEDADQALSVAVRVASTPAPSCRCLASHSRAAFPYCVPQRLQRALADALPGKQHRARSPHRGPLRRGEGAGGEVAE